MTEEEGWKLHQEYLDLNFKGATINEGWFVDEVTKEIGSKVYGFGVVTTSWNTGTTTFEPFEGIEVL